MEAQELSGTNGTFYDLNPQLKEHTDWFEAQRS